MYDPLTSTFSLSCPHRGEARLPLSAFRTLDRLPGPEHPAVFTVLFACPCGDVHPALVSHDDLDLAPLGLNKPRLDTATTFRNLMTAHDDPLEAELADLAATHIRAGEWPWSFFCHLEECPRPITPSAITWIVPGVESPSAADARLGVAVRCPSCATMSVNLVSREHVDIPFWNDARVAVVDHVFAEDSVRAVEGFREDLLSARFDERRMDLEL